MADSWEEHFQSIVPSWSPQQAPTPAPSSSPGPSWSNFAGREAGIAGTRLLAPSVGTLNSLFPPIPYGPHRGLQPFPSYSDVLGWGPTPQGTGENMLAGGSLAAGYALPAAALMLGAEAAILPESVTGLSLLANTLRPAAKLTAGAFGGGAATSGYGSLRESYPYLPGGPLANLTVGMAGGGLAGSVIGAPYGGAPVMATQPSWPKIIGSGLFGGAVDFGLRHGLGIPPGVGYALGQGAEGLLLRSRLGLGGGGPNVPAIAGGETGMLLGAPPGGQP